MVVIPAAPPVTPVGKAQVYVVKPPGAAVNTVLPDAQTNVLAAVADTEGNALTVIVMGTVVAVHAPLVLTTRLKSYTPAATLDGIVIGNVDGPVTKLNDWLTILVKPAIALTPVDKEYSVGEPVEE